MPTNNKPQVKRITGVKGGKGGNVGKHNQGRRFNVKTLKAPKQERIDKLLASDGIYQTYFAAEGGGLKPGYVFQGHETNDGQFNDGFYSNNYFGKQLWRAKEPPGKTHGPLGDAGPRYNGRVPFQELMDTLNFMLNVNDDGTDFRQAFEYWTYRYEVSYSVKTDSGLYQVVIETFGDESATPKPSFGYERFIKE